MKDFLLAACFILLPLFTHYALGLSPWLNFTIWGLGAVVIIMFIASRTMVPVRKKKTAIAEEGAFEL